MNRTMIILAIIVLSFWTYCLYNFSMIRYLQIGSIAVAISVALYMYYVERKQKSKKHRLSK